MRYTDATSTDCTGDYTITFYITSTGNDCDKVEEYVEDDYDWMKEGWNKPYLKLLSLIIIKIVIPRARSLIQYQKKYPKHL